ncbi:MAG: hypothetical protein JJU10_10910 [Idiomarina sp.]|nr:hypothetical protein [Idiomarina sp.]
MTQEKPQDTRVSWKEAEVFFDRKGHLIRVWFSTYSGHEKVYVDDQLVSEGRSWRFKNVHHFDIDGEPHELELFVEGWKSLLLGIYSLRLKSNGLVVDMDQVEFMEKLGMNEDEKFSWRKFLVGLLPWILIGGVGGYFFGYALASWF